MRPIPPEDICAGLPDMELNALLALIETIGRLPSPQARHAGQRLTTGLAKRAKGAKWAEAMRKVYQYLDAVAPEAPPRPEEQKASPRPAMPAIMVVHPKEV